MNIIHHSNYIKWMEEARIEYMDSLGFGFVKVEELGIMSPVAGITINYKSPVRFGDIVDITVSITRYSGVIQEIAYEINNRTTGQLSALILFFLTLRYETFDFAFRRGACYGVRLHSG